MFNHRIAWRRSWNAATMCTENERGSQDVLFGFGSLTCTTGCTGTVGYLQFFCTDFSLDEDWISGERSFIYNIDTSVGYFEAQ